MKVFVNGILYDSEKECIALVFDNDDQRRLVGQHLTEMADRDDELPRVYASYPGQMEPGQFDDLCQKIDDAVKGAPTCPAKSGNFAASAACEVSAAKRCAKCPKK